MSKISKLGFGIVSFEGNEHLKNIIWEIRDLCDHITVCLQKKSYHGDDISQNDVAIVEDLKDKGYVDSIIWFEPTDMHEEEKEVGSIPRMIETDKRNFILDYLQNEQGCSHSMIIDSDEFYEHDDFALGKKYIDENEEIKVSYCRYVNYYRDYEHVMVWPFECYVPFITEAGYRFDFKNGSFDRPSDPTRRYRIPEKDGKFSLFGWKFVKMHHLSWIRKDIEKKIDSWSAKKLFKNYDVLRNRILDRYMNYIDGQNAIIMFNVPENSVPVNKLPKKFIHPKFRLDEEPLDLKKEK